MGPRRLILLRHGQAHPEDPKTRDFERTLTPRGAREAGEAGRTLASAGFKPDLIIASPAARTWATAAIVAEQCGIGKALIEAEPALYQAGEQTIWRLVGTCESRDGARHDGARHDAARRDGARSIGCLLVCGHNPGLSQLASRLGPAPAHRGLPTAGIATALWTRGDWADLQPDGAQRFDQFVPRRTS